VPIVEEDPHGILSHEAERAMHRLNTAADANADGKGVSEETAEVDVPDKYLDYTINENLQEVGAKAKVLAGQQRLRDQVEEQPEQMPPRVDALEDYYDQYIGGAFAGAESRACGGSWPAWLASSWAQCGAPSSCQCELHAFVPMRAPSHTCTVATSRYALHRHLASTAITAVPCLHCSIAWTGKHPPSNLIPPASPMSCCR
jgi:hypothetical protein